ncbi:hypothetical protein N0V83_001342 [Neocucurbitaria cava]|uniref:LysM domain-containing protein n=1 Tax=Neocucurbitaria cava TaxID=798079 RepID=A0A9W8YEQ0_9PLEO|nr:hypothetical protein N0V83_001342 [Neocucurbitaria cava]
MLGDNYATLEDFRRWNPTIGANCAGLTSGRSYCVEALFEVIPTSSAVPTSKPTSKPQSSSTKAPTTPAPTPTAKPTPSSVKAPVTSSTTTPGNGIETPVPTQPNIVSNCDKFYLVKSGDQCASIASQFGITLAKFLAWNPSAGSSCGGLWADAYACVSIIGEDATPIPSATPTPTSPGNGISTPQPTQPNLVSNCDKFYLVKSGDTCANIASANGITVAQFTAWNPAAGSSCAGLWADAYACVSIVGHEPSKPTPTPTNPGNGVQTPTPTQPGMVTNCKKFDFVKQGDTCDAITKRNNISLANFTKWNTGVGSTCTSMWAESYVCVGV